MSNPFEYFAADDDEEKFQPVPKEEKPKRTNAEKRQYKQQQQPAATSSAGPVITEELPSRHKDDLKQIRNTRHPPTPLTKKLGQGHFHDRRSGTGRVDKPRKAGGGLGNVGNVKDDLNQEKYIKQTPEKEQAENTVEEGQAETQEEPKPQEPEALTLEEYYKNKGIDIQNTFEQKGPAKKGDISAEWIKKEKLTVMETKEDKKAAEKKAQNIAKFADGRTGIDSNLEALGFNSKPQKRTEEKREPRSTIPPKGGKTNQKGKEDKKVILNEEDFPSL